MLCGNKDDRGFFVLPQHPEESGYYTYGTPINGQGQFSHPKMLTFLLVIEQQWAHIDKRKFGIGNISLADGHKFKPHLSHKTGMEVDIRPIRKDGQFLPVSYQDKIYDRDATQKLIKLMWGTGYVKGIYFNDATIHQVKPLAGHHNHLHIELIK